MEDLGTDRITIKLVLEKLRWEDIVTRMTIARERLGKHIPEVTSQQ
jgi:hypothetical protein